MIVELTDCSPAWPFPYSMQTVRDAAWQLGTEI
jgi:hypothetical protein